MMVQDTNLDNYERILDRKQAIKKAILDAKKNDLLLFLGKGVDKYMAIEDRRDYYDEEKEIIDNINKISAQ